MYDHLSYVDFTRIATLSPELSRLTLTIGSVGKLFYCTGWRLGFVIGAAELVQHVTAVHTRICFSSTSVLQEAAAAGFERAREHDFWNQSKSDMQRKCHLFNAVWDELGLPYTRPDGSYFTLVNMRKVRLPEEFERAEGPRDMKLCRFLMEKIGVAAIPPSGEFIRVITTPPPPSFHLFLPFAGLFAGTPLFQLGENGLMGFQNWKFCCQGFWHPTHAADAGAYDLLRFSWAKDDALLEKGKERLRALKAYIK